MQDIKSKNTKHSLSKRRGVLICVVVFVLIGLLVDITISHNMRFYLKWIECGQKPFQTGGSGYLNDGAIHYYEPSSLPGIHATIDYFCTPLEAEQAGYSANPYYYEFPHLNK